jgi:type II secretory pathway component PulJ
MLRFRINESGFSIMEMFVALGLSAIIITAFIQLFIYSGKSTTWNEQEVQASRDARQTMMRLARDIRHAGLIAFDDCNGDSNDIDTDVLGETFTDSLNEIIEEALWNSITFQADIDQDSVTETIRYYIEGDQLKRYVWEWDPNTGWQPEIEGRVVGNNIDYFIISYFGGNNIPIPMSPPVPYTSLNLSRHERAAVRSVQVDIITRSERENHQKVHGGTYPGPDGLVYNDGFVRQHLTSIIKCRNLQ